MKINSRETSAPLGEINHDYYLQMKQDIKGIYSKSQYYKKRKNKNMYKYKFRKRLKGNMPDI